MVGQAANDDIAGSVEIKRTYTRHKPWRADLRTNTELLTILPEDYAQGRRAWRQSWERGLGLDCMVTIRPLDFEILTPEQRWEGTKRWMRRFREFHRANDNLPAEYAYMLARESKRDGKVGRHEHVHWLINTGGRQDIVETYFRKRFTESDYEVDVAPRDQRLVYLCGGKVGDASTYLLKACHQHVWGGKDKTIPHRPSGPVYGPRILWSTNINDVQPLHRIDPKTRKDRAARSARQAA